VFQLPQSRWNLLLWKEWWGHNLSDPGIFALVSVVKGLKAKFDIQDSLIFFNYKNRIQNSRCLFFVSS